MRIGEISLDNPFVLAPMAGVTDLPFRLLAKKHKAALVYSEMVSAQGLVYGNQKTHRILDSDPFEKPLSVQLFGSDPSVLAEAALMVQDNGADLIDINLGCPVPKIVKNGEGSYLMKEPSLVAKIVRRVSDSINVPLTVKIRKGWDRQSVNAVEIAQIAEDSGAQAVAVHGRTRDQYYSGKADWRIITKVKEKCKIPVIGNGDVTNPKECLVMLGEVGCDGVMIGRGAMGNPWIFSRSLSYLEKKRMPSEPSIPEKIMTAISHLHKMTAYKGETRGVKEMRKHAAWYIKNMRGAAKIRNKLNQAVTADQMEKILLDYGESLTGVLKEGWMAEN